METETIKLLYGVESLDDVYKSKSEGHQTRSMLNGADGPATLTANECKALCAKVNGTGIEYMSGYEARVVRYTITDETSDRYGDIVRAKGVVLNNYKKNSVVQFAHDYTQPPVGMSLKTWYDKETNAVKSLTLYYDDRVDASGRSSLIHRFVTVGGMRGCSIGFMPLKTNRPKDNEERKELGLGDYGVEFESIDLMEFSACPVPANPNALTDSIRDNLMRSIRSGAFTANDVDVLKSHELFQKDILDMFVKELGSAMIVKPEPVTAAVDGVAKTEREPDASTAPTVDPVAEPISNTTAQVDLSPVVNSIAALAEIMREVKQSIIANTEILSAIRSGLTQSASPAAAPVESEKSHKRLWDEILLTSNKEKK